MVRTDYYKNGRHVPNADDDYVYQKQRGCQKQRDYLMGQKLAELDRQGDLQGKARTWHELAMLPNFRYDVGDYFRAEADVWVGYHWELCVRHVPTGAMRAARGNAIAAMQNAVQANDYGV